MKRSLLVLFAFLSLACAQAQGSYIGFHLSGNSSSSGVTPFGGLQVGVPVADDVELRLSGLTVILANVLQLDFLYTQGLSGALKGYAGGGVDVLQVAFAEDGVAYAVHVTAGVEADVGSGIGLFAETQPTYVVNAPERAVALLFGNEGADTFFGTLSLGVNVHF